MLEHLALAAGIGAVGVIALLLLGTQIMNWYWPVLLFIGAAGAGLWRLQSQRLNRYQLAQVVDARLGMDDRISTTIYFRGKLPVEVLAPVERQATERLGAADMRIAAPVSMPRHGYVSIALAVAAVGALVVRYGVLHTFDLRPPIASLEFGVFTPAANVQAATKKSAIQENFEEQLKQMGLPPEDLQAPDEEALRPIETTVPAAGDEPGAEAGDAKGKREGNSPQPTPNGESAEAGEASDGDAAAGEEGAQGQPDARAGKPGTQPPSTKDGNPGGQNGLMNKMRDALANLLNKLNIQPPPSEQQTASLQQQSQPNREGPMSQGGTQTKGKGQGDGESKDNAEGEKGNEAGDNASGDRSKAGDKDGDQPGGQNSKTGMGKQDGEKAIREAEQVAAMGKISEIFGKRAQQLTGEMTVEVSSGKQGLKTAWSERSAGHSNAGGEIGRDEVPLAYQTYVQRYFEEIRKTPPKPARN